MATKLSVELVTVVPTKDGYRITVEGLTSNIEDVLTTILDLDVWEPEETPIGEVRVPLEEPKLYQLGLFPPSDIAGEDVVQ